MSNFTNFNSLRVGQFVKVNGKMQDDGCFLAVEVTANHNARYVDIQEKIESEIQSIDHQSGKLRLLNQELFLTPATTFSTDRHQPSAFKAFQTGEKIKVRGQYQPGQGFITSRITAQETLDFNIEELEGRISEIDYHQRTFAVNGVVIKVNDKAILLNKNKNSREDRKLPGLQIARDNERMLGILAANLNGEISDRISNIASINHQLLKYKYGKRCVIEYAFCTADNAAAEMQVIGKLYRKKRGERIFLLMQQLWDKSQQQNDEPKFGMAQPLAYLPELGMVLQTKVPGKRLAEVTSAEDLPSVMGWVGKNLAKLHRLSSINTAQRTMAQHIKKYCHPGPSKLLGDFPSFSTIVDELLSVFLSVDEPQKPSMLVHGDLNLSQIFIHDQQAYFIDLDSACLAQPALDIGNFYAVLETHFPKNAPELKRCFLDGYRQIQPKDGLSDLPVYHAFAYFRRAMICYRQRRMQKNCKEQIEKLLNKADLFLHHGNF